MVKHNSYSQTLCAFSSPYILRTRCATTGISHTIIGAYWRTLLNFSQCKQSLQPVCHFSWIATYGCVTYHTTILLYAMALKSVVNIRLLVLDQFVPREHSQVHMMILCSVHSLRSRSIEADFVANNCLWWCCFYITSWNLFRVSTDTSCSSPLH